MNEKDHYGNWHFTAVEADDCMYPSETGTVEMWVELDGHVGLSTMTGQGSVFLDLKQVDSVRKKLKP